KAIPRWRAGLPGPTSRRKGTRAWVACAMAGFLLVAAFGLDTAARHALHFWHVIRQPVDGAAYDLFLATGLSVLILLIALYFTVAVGVVAVAGSRGRVIFNRLYLTWWLVPPGAVGIAASVALALTPFGERPYRGVFPIAIVGAGAIGVSARRL